MKKRLGDIIEVKVARGFAYGQYTHEAPENLGSIVRLFQGIFLERPDLTLISFLPVRFTILFPLGSALTRNKVERFGNVPIREELVDLPIFRCRLPADISIIKPKRWALWQGADLNIIENRESLLKTIPVMRSWSMPDLIDRLNSTNNDELI